MPLTMETSSYEEVVEPQTKSARYQSTSIPQPDIDTQCEPGAPAMASLTTFHDLSFELQCLILQDVEDNWRAPMRRRMVTAQVNAHKLLLESQPSNAPWALFGHSLFTNHAVHQSRKALLFHVVCGK